MTAETQLPILSLYVPMILLRRTDFSNWARNSACACYDEHWSVRCFL